MIKSSNDGPVGFTVGATFKAAPYAREDANFPQNPRQRRKWFFEEPVVKNICRDRMWLLMRDGER